MALKLELKAGERLYIGEHVIVNANDRRMKVVIETKSRMLRESELLSQSDAVTLCDELQVAMQDLYLAHDPKPNIKEVVRLTDAIGKAMPGFQNVLDEIMEHVEGDRIYPALKVSRALREREAAILSAMVPIGDQRVP